MLLALGLPPADAQPAGSPESDAAPAPVALVGVTLVDTAREVHSPGMTVLVERDRIRAVFPTGEQTLPPGTEVHDLGGRHVHMRTGPEAAAAPILLDAGQGEPIAFPIHPTLRLADPESNLAGMSFFELRIPAGTAGAPPHTHKYEDEFFYVREGTITFMANEERKTLEAGGFVLLPRQSLHAFWNTSDEEAILLVGTSAGRFGDFFDAVAMAVRASGASAPSEIGAILGRVGEERGIVIDMTKVPEDVAALYGL